MKRINDLWHDYAEVILMVSFLALSILVLLIVFKADKDTWNNGYCECGGRWEYVSTETNYHRTDKSGYTTHSYVYRCDRCNRLHEFVELR